MIVPLIQLPAPFLTDAKSIMPLGLLYLGASLEQHNIECRIIDLANVSEYEKYAIQQLKQFDPKIVGIGLTTSQVPIAKQLVKLIRVEFPGIRIIAGGPHVTHTFQSHKRQPIRTKHLVSDLYDTYDVLIMGDAEKAILDGIKEDSPRLIDATCKLSPYYVDSSFLETLAFPARHLLDVPSYQYNLGMVSIKKNRAINILSQRGCPYACRFCASRLDKFGRVIRKISFKKVIEEIKFLYTTYGYVDFTFYDDELNVNPKLNELLISLKQIQFDLGQQFRFRAFVRANLCTQDQIQKLSAAGFKVIVIGAESGSDRILQNMNKKVTVDENTKVINWCCEADIYTKSIISIGHPGESDETLIETDKWLDKVKLDDVNFTIIECLPSSIYFDNAVQSNGGIWVYTTPETGDRLYDSGVDWTKSVHFFNGKPGITYVPTVYTDFLNGEDIVKWHSYFENKYK